MDHVTARAFVDSWVTAWNAHDLDAVLAHGRRPHQIPAMRTHLTALDHGRMDPASAGYMIRIKGHLGATLLSAFPALAWKRQGQEPEERWPGRGDTCSP